MQRQNEIDNKRTKGKEAVVEANENISKIVNKPAENSKLYDVPPTYQKIHWDVQGREFENKKAALQNATFSL